MYTISFKIKFFDNHLKRIAKGHLAHCLPLTRVQNKRCSKQYHPLHNATCPPLNWLHLKHSRILCCLPTAFSLKHIFKGLLLHKISSFSVVHCSLMFLRRGCVNRLSLIPFGFWVHQVLWMGILSCQLHIILFVHRLHLLCFVFTSYHKYS